jgi:cation:H+ antiporter
MNYVMLIGGLVALVIGGELIVHYGVKLAEALKVPSLVIGLTVVAIGTSIPELAVGIDGIRRGVGSLVLGNMVGTDIVNVLLILGLSALIRPIDVPPGVLKFDLPMMTISSALLWFVSLNGAYLSMWNGVLFLSLGVAYMVFLVTTARRRTVPDLGLTESVITGQIPVIAAVLPVTGSIPAVGGKKKTKQTMSEALADSAYDTESASASSGEEKKLTPKQFLVVLLLLVVGLGVILVGANLLVGGATGIAEALGVSETLIGLTVVAIGTSAPELVTTIIATIRNERGLAFGNLIGSSTLNLTIILGTALLFAREHIPVDPSLLWLSMPLMILVGLVCVPVFFSGRRINRVEGGLFVAAYAVYLGYNIITA